MSRTDQLRCSCVLCVIGMANQVRRLAPSERSAIVHHFWFNLMLFLLGFALWNIDNIFCDQLAALRERVGVVVAPLLQLHGWWHVLTGIATYQFVVMISQVRALIIGRPLRMRTVAGVFSYQERVRGTAAAAAAAEGDVRRSARVAARSPKS